jgi:hypothetical protein
MKKFYTFTLLLFGMVATFAQTIVYSENFGTPSGTTPIASHTFQNSSPITYSGTADVRATQGSTGYTGASAGGNVFFTNTAGRFLLIEGINTSAYPTADLSLSFGIRQEGGTPAVPASALQLEYSIDGINFLPLSYNRTVNSTWEQVTISSGIPSALNLRLRFTQTATTQYRIDDVRITALASTCVLSLGAATAQCATVTGEIDTYTVTIPFTNGGLATYNVVASHGTISGDNPSTASSGNIIITGINENVDMSVTITGGTCNLIREVDGIVCKPINTLPYNESFDYTAGNILGFQQMWSEYNSGDSAVILPGNLNYPGVNSTGNSAGFGGTGAETFTPVTLTTTGAIYASFLFNITDMSNVTTEGAQTYIAALTGDEFSEYNVRLFVRKAGAGFNIGLASGGNTTTNYTTTTYNTGEVVMVIMGYDYGTGTLSAWINPNLATFTSSTPATLTETPATPPASFESFGGFILRQDSDTLTPAGILFDELRMVTSLDALSVKSNEIANFAMYPNPVSGGVLTITSDNAADKEVAIYDMLGKEVVNAKTVNGNVNVSALTSGIYMVKITEEGKTATRKLVVR